MHMNAEDLEWCRKHMAKHPFEPMVAAMGPRLDRYGACAVGHLSEDPYISTKECYGVDELIPLL